MTVEAWVTRAEGTTVVAAEAWVTRVTGLVASTPEAWVSRVRGTTDVGPAALVLEVRGLADAAANAPTVVAGTDRTWPSGAKVHLTCTATPKAGATIAGYTWRVVSKSSNGGTVVFDDPSIREPSFRAPLRKKLATYTLGVVATDSAGRVSPEATTTVTIEQAEILVATSAGWQPSARGYAVAALSGSGRWT